MDFNAQKEKTLNWKDLSKKGSIDPQIKPLLDKINSFDNYYTTSSCAGRISVLALSPSHKKHESEWLYVNHDTANFDDVKKSLKKLSQSEVWFKMESAIFHVCAKTIEDANELLIKAIKSGFKHSGILSISDRIIIEVMGSEKLETIIAKEGKLLISDDYLKEIIIIVNKKLEKNKERISLLLKCLDNHCQD